MLPSQPELVEMALQRQRALLEEADRERLASLARGARPRAARVALRAIRVRLAGALYALAAWLDDREALSPAPPAPPERSEPLLRW